jgi:phage gpG-like protein
MAFQQEVIGLKDLERNLKAIANLVPGGELADSLADGAWDIAIRAKANAKAHGLFDTYDLIESIQPRKVNQYRVDVEVGVIYGAVHEFGYTGTITDKQRRFFWAMYAETKDEMWKALALSETYTIPERAYLRPAIDTEKRKAIEHAGRSLGDKVKEAVR